MLVRENCTQCSNPIEQSPRHPDPTTCRGLLCRRCFGEVHWAWIMWKCGPVPHGHNCVEECCADNKGTPLNAKTAARPHAIAAAMLASTMRVNKAIKDALALDYCARGFSMLAIGDTNTAALLFDRAAGITRWTV